MRGPVSPQCLDQRSGNTINFRKIEWSDSLGKIIECVDRNTSHEVFEKVINHIIIYSCLFQAGLFTRG